MQQAGFVLKDGYIKGLDGAGNLRFDVYYEDSLYAVVWHRNHLGIMSAFGLKNPFGTYNYNFTNAAGKSFGGNQAVKEISPGVWGMISGDGDGDGQVSLPDKDNLWEIQAGQPGYLGSDLDLNSEVNNQDKDDHWFPNLGKGTLVPD